MTGPADAAVTRVVGLISGTSADGIDAAVADLWQAGDQLVLDPRGCRTFAYPDRLRAAVLAALPPAGLTMAQVCALDTEIGQAFADAAQRVVAELGSDRPADLVVSHGQTAFHWVAEGRTRGTLQLGQPAWIAAATGLPVVADLRAADVAAGGQGAPLVSLVDVWWLRSRPQPTVALNLGGIANLTARVETDSPVAYDVGPANALIDAWVQHRSAGRLAYDVEGRWAAAGTVDRDAVDLLLADPWFAAPPPKSTGRERFHLGWVADRLGPDWPARTSDADGAATLTEVTSASVAAALRAEQARTVVLSGGGSHNPVLRDGIAARAPGTTLLDSDDLGLPADGKEAYAFAVLGWLSWHGLPGTLPSCTGARRATVLGSITTSGRRTPEPPSVVPRSLVVRPSAGR